MRKKIMVPLGPEVRDLKSVHYALAAAERLQASVILLLLANQPSRWPAWLEEALTDLVASARLAGLEVTIVEAKGTPFHEVVDFAQDERIDLLVFSDDQRQLEEQVLELAPRLAGLMIQVRGKDTVKIETEHGGSRWQS